VPGVDGDRATVAADDVAADRETETRPAGRLMARVIQAREALEDPLVLVRRDPRAVVADRQDRMFIVLGERDRDLGGGMMRGVVPPQLVAPTNSALKALAKAIKTRKAAAARAADALAVAQATLDLQLQFRPVVQIDLARSDLWARQVLVDAPLDDIAAISGDTANLEWIRDRIARSLDSVVVTRIDTLLEQLRSNVKDGDATAAAETAVALRDLLARACLVG